MKFLLSFIIIILFIFLISVYSNGCEEIVEPIEIVEVAVQVEGGQYSSGYEDSGVTEIKKEK